MRFIGKNYALLLVSLSMATASFGQASGSNISSHVNTITTAVPFLRIAGDTRSGGMGDVGIAISPDANGAQLNGAKMAFIEDDYGVGLSFTPWLKSLVGDIYLANLDGFVKIKDPAGGQTVHASLRYFSLGSVQYTDDQGNNTIQVHPNEFYVDAGYSRKIGDIAAVGATLRFIYSNIAPNAGTNIQSVKPGIAGSADISVLVDKTFNNKGKGDLRHELLWGLDISNIGSKMTYTSNINKDFLPCNLGIGFGYKLHLDAKDDNTVGIYADFNKLLVPTPNQPVGGSATAPNGYALSAKQQGEDPITGIVTSFYDAPGGASEELKSISAQVGAEYWFKKMFAFRAGYFYEDPTKGNRNFLTVGASVKYSVATLHVSYLIPTSNQRNPLDNTFSFSLAFQFKKGGLKKKPEATDGTPAEPATPKGKKGAKKAVAPDNSPASTPSSDPDPTKQ
jgi:Type IX secretion system protein PorV